MEQNNPNLFLTEKSETGCKDCPHTDGCTKVSCQYADISMPVELKPNVKIGNVTTECCGEPVVICKNNCVCETLELCITQKISVKIPISYNVEACIGDSRIDCGCDKKR